MQIGRVQDGECTAARGESNHTQRYEERRNKAGAGNARIDFLQIRNHQNPGDFGKTIELGDEFVFFDIECLQLSGTHVGDVKPARGRIETLVIDPIRRFAKRKISNMGEQAAEGHRGILVRALLS